MHELIIKKNDSGQRLDKFLTKTYRNLPMSLLYKAIRKKDIKLNGKRCEISSRLATVTPNFSPSSFVRYSE